MPKNGFLFGDQVQLIVDVELSAKLFELPFSKQNGITALLDIAKLTKKNQPLEQFIFEAFGLGDCLELPIAAVAASADGIAVGNRFWLRADPVHLDLQRDAFALNGDFPLSVDQAHANTLLAMFNQHFNADGIYFHLGISGAWYIQLEERLIDGEDLQTILPLCAIGKDMNQLMPTGRIGRQLVRLQNEVQMLLHEHPVNAEREKQGLLSINSVWVNGGGRMPMIDTHSAPINGTLVGSSPFYEGLAKYANMNYAAINTINQVSAFFALMNAANQDLRLELKQDAYLEDWFFSLKELLQLRKVDQLTINFGWYEQTITASIQPLYLYKFWHKSHTLQEYFK